MQLPYSLYPLPNKDLPGMSDYGAHPDDVPDSSINKFSNPIPQKGKGANPIIKYAIALIVLILIVAAVYFFVIK